MTPSALALFALCPLASAQTTWYVDVNGTPPGTGSQGDPYTSIQYAIDQPATVDFDKLLVLPGTYFESVDYAGKDLRIESRDGPEVTVLDAQYAGTAVVTEGGTSGSAALIGFTVTHGENLLGDFGGAVRVVNAGLTIVECVLVQNGDLGSSSPVAGIYGEQADLFVTNTRIAANGFSDQFGAAAMHLVDSQVNVQFSTLEDNRGGRGGAIYVSGGLLLLEFSTLAENTTNNEPGAGMFVEGGGTQVVVVDCLFERNKNHFEDYPGAGMYIADGTVSVLACDFVGNEGNRGGAIANVGGAVEVIGCTFVENVAEVTFCCGTGDGGAIHSSGTTVNVRRSVFIGNEARGGDFGTGRGGALWGAVFAERCTFLGNAALLSGGAAEGATLTNAIVWGNAPDQLAGGAVATWSDVEGSWPGQGNIAADPLFLSEEYPDVHLRPGSPCIDAGDPGSTADPDGSIADMGAFPFNGTYVPEPQPYCAGKENSRGCTAAMGWTGTPTLGGPDDFFVVADDVLGGQFGLMIWGPAADDVPFFGGTLCVGQPFVRTPVTTSGGTGGGVDCSGQLSFHFSQAYMASKGVPAYETIHAQWWYRDPGFPPPTNVGLSNGLRFLVVP